MTQPEIPLDTRSLFKPLQEKLLELLRSLNEEDWNRQTVAKKWKVKDVVSHILDGQLKTLSLQRDSYFGDSPPEIRNQSDLINWLNLLNQDWVKATKRLSPQVLTMLLESIGDKVSDYYSSLNPWDVAIFPVSWAGESTSYNWMHVAREYTEFWHHQQQIRGAVDKPGILTREFFYPVLDTFFQAQPYTFRDVISEPGTVVETIITSEAGGRWYLISTADGWRLDYDCSSKPTASVTIPAEFSWILFTKSIRAADIIDKIQISGNRELALKVLEMVSVMA